MYEDRYEQLLRIYASIYGGGRPALENKIRSLMRKGLGRDEAVYRLAEKELSQKIEVDTEKIRSFFRALIDKSLLKDWRIFAFAPIMYVSYVLATLLPMYGSIYNIQWMTSVSFTVIFLLVFLFTFLSDPLKRSMRMTRLERDKKTWLQLCLFFAVSFMISEFVLVPTGLWLTFQAHGKSTLYYLLWLQGMITVFPYYVDKLKNSLGMETVGLKGDSILGARAFALLSRVTLEKQRKRGLEHLTNAVQMLRNSLASEDLRVENLDKLGLVLESFQLLNSEIDYDKLTELSSTLENASSLENMTESIDKFLGSGEHVWHGNLIRVERRISTDIFLKTLTLGITIVAAVVAAFSEELKAQISSLLVATSLDILIIILVLALYFLWVRTTSSFLTRIPDPRDLVKLDAQEATEFNSQVQEEPIT